MKRPSVETIAIVALGTLLVGGLLLLLRSRDDAAVDPAPVGSTAESGPFRDADGAVRLRWTTESDRGAQGDFVVIIADGFEARLEGPLARYRVEGTSVFCYSADEELACESDPVETALIPTAGKITLAADEAGSRTIAGRTASCWRFETGDTATQTCADDETGISLLEETIDGATGELFRQVLVDWGPASAADRSLPSEVEELVG